MQWFEGTAQSQTKKYCKQGSNFYYWGVLDFSYLAVHKGHEVFMVQLSQLLQDFYFFPE